MVRVRAAAKTAAAVAREMVVHRMTSLNKGEEIGKDLMSLLSSVSLILPSDL